LFKRLKKDWAEQLAELSHELKQIAPWTLRVNVNQVSRNEYLQILEEEGYEARSCTLSEVGIVLEQNVHIPNLPGYEAGGFSVQDENAELCAALVPGLEGKVVVDAGVAPSGKTAHILSKYKPKKLYAVDQDAKR